MKKKPNIVYVFADQWRRQAMGSQNEDPVKTPVMNKFSQESMLFKQAVTSTPLCSPHRASLITGKYPLSTGVYTNCKTGADIMLQPDEIGIGDVLKEAGYQTGYIGKWHLDLPDLNTSNHPESGARNWDAYTPPGPKRMGFDYWYSYGAWDNHLAPHYWEDTPDKIQVNEWSVKHETDKAIQFINKAKNNTPFALFVSWNPPHTPFEDVPDKYKEMYKDLPRVFRKNVMTDEFEVHTGEEIKGDKDDLFEKQKDYFAAISGLDENFGRILNCLKDNQLEEDTIIVLTADHGEMLGSHGMMAKHVWYEESIGVPFVIRWPTKIPAQETDTLLNTVDIMPTLLKLADLEVPSSVEGTDLSQIVKGKSVNGPKEAFISAFPGRDVALQAFEKAGENNLENGWRAVRTATHTYVIHNGYEPGDVPVAYLYDLKHDPYQLNPKVIKNPSEDLTAQKLHERLKEWLLKRDDPFKTDYFKRKNDGVKKRIDK